MTSNVIEMRPGIAAVRAAAGVAQLSEIGWVLGPDGRWHPPVAEEQIKGPFVLAVQANCMKLVEEAAYHARIEGHASGVRTMLPYVGAALIVGFLMGLAV